MFYLPSLKRRTLILIFITAFVLALFSSLSLTYPDLSLTNALLFTFYELYQSWTPSRVQKKIKIAVLHEKKPALHQLCEEVQKNMISKKLLSANKSITFYMTDDDSCKNPIFLTSRFDKKHAIIIGNTALEKLCTAQGTFDIAAFQGILAHELGHATQHACISNKFLRLMTYLTKFIILSNFGLMTYLLTDLFTILSFKSIERNNEYNADHLAVKCGYGKGLQRGLTLITDQTPPSFFQSCYFFILEIFTSHPFTKHRILTTERDIALQEELQEDPPQSWIIWAKACCNTAFKETKHAFYNEIESYTTHFQSNEILLNAKNNQNVP